jgi:hypothetical protein
VHPAAHRNVEINVGVIVWIVGGRYLTFRVGSGTGLMTTFDFDGVDSAAAATREKEEGLMM